MATETELYHAWRLLDSVARGQAANLEQRTNAVAPSQSLHEKDLAALGFSIIDGRLVQTGEAPPEGFLPEDFELGTRLKPDAGLPPSEIDNTLPTPGDEKPPPGSEGGPLESEPQTSQHSAEHRRGGGILKKK